MKEILHKFATDKTNTFAASCIKVILGTAAFLYGVGLRIVLFCYQTHIFKRHHLEKKVISIGNITVGGVGKTPLVELICKLLEKNGFKPVVLMRGYMDSHDIGISDEAELLKEALPDTPILVGKNRVESVKQVPEDYPADVFVMDDAFQHWRVYRDLDIVAIDSTNPFGNGYLIPRGILREPLASLKRADMFVLTKTQNDASRETTIKNQLLNMAPKRPIVETIHEPRCIYNIRSTKEVDLSRLNGKSLCCFSSIGAPDSFVSLLEKLGANIVRHFSFIDHYVYKHEDIERINSFCINNNISTIITTQKDVVKLVPLLPYFDEKMELLRLDIQIKITKGEEGFLNTILSLCRY